MEREIAVSGSLMGISEPIQDHCTGTRGITVISFPGEKRSFIIVSTATLFLEQVE